MAAAIRNLHESEIQWLFCTHLYKKLKYICNMNTLYFLNVKKKNNAVGFAAFMSLVV